MIPSGMILLIHSYFYSTLHIQRKHAVLYAQVIICAIFLPYALRYHALQNAHMPQTLLYNLGPIITYFMAHFFNIEKITAQRSLALCLSFIGLLFWLNTSLTDLVSTPLGLSEYALILSIISFSYGWIAMHKLIVYLEYSPTLINGITMLGGGVLALAAALTLESNPFITSDLSPFIPLLTLTIVASNLTAHNIYAALLRTYSLTLIQLGYWLVPVMRALTQAIFTQKIPIPISSMPAVFLLVIGFYFFYREEQTYLNKSAARLTNI